jgi:hypothetical protein
MHSFLLAGLTVLLLVVSIVLLTLSVKASNRHQQEY